jgi:hypothetical protein
LCIALPAIWLAGGAVVLALMRPILLVILGGW